MKQLLPDDIVIDCRSQVAFEKRHYIYSVNIPAENLFWRMQELPVKSNALRIIVDEETFETAKIFFSERDFLITDYIDWNQLNTHTDVEFVKGPSSCFFWQPADFVKTFSNVAAKHLNPDARILDLACGSGRDAIYLAMKHYNVVGVDYSETALKRCRLSAKHYQVNVQTYCVDLEAESFHSNQAPFNQLFDGIVVCRYLHRPLFDSIKNWIAPGGLIGYHTFMQGSEQFGSPRNPKFLLKNGELIETFGGFEILLNEVITLADGRPMSHFIAKKPNA